MSSSFLKKLEKEKAAATAGGQGNPLSLINLMILDSEMKEQAGDDEDMEDEEKKDSIKE
jgi:hypothetical protein